MRVCTKKHVRERVAELLAKRALAADCEAAAATLLTRTSGDDPGRDDAAEAGPYSRFLLSAGT